MHFRFENLHLILAHSKVDDRAFEHFYSEYLANGDGYGTLLLLPVWTCDIKSAL